MFGGTFGEGYGGYMVGLKIMVISLVVVKAAEIMMHNHH